MILRGGEREILKAAASTKAQNLPAEGLGGQIKTAKFYRKSRQGAIKSCEFILASVAKFYLLMLAKGYLCPARKVTRHANYRDRSSHNSRRFVRIVIERRKEALRKFSGLTVFLAFAYCVQFGVGDDSYVRVGGAALIVFFIFALAFFELYFWGDEL